MKSLPGVGTYCFGAEAQNLALVDQEFHGVGVGARGVLPGGVEIPELRFGKEHDHAIAVAKEIKEEIEETPVAAEGDAAAAAATAAGAAAPAAGATAAGAAPAKKDEKK